MQVPHPVRAHGLPRQEGQDRRRDDRELDEGPDILGVSFAMKVCNFTFNESSAVTTTVAITARSTSPWNTTAPMTQASMAVSSVVMPSSPCLEDMT